MRVQWEETDIKPGRVVGKTPSGERWMIGFIAHENSERRYVLVSQRDGMVTTMHGKRELALSMIESGYIPAELL